jgi:negative regulator of sigma-B (phosphoserine phosphatase)
MTIRWSAAGRPKEGQIVSGDAYTVIEQEAGLLVALVDGLGGGEEAAVAARKAIETVETHADKRLKEITEICHRQMHGTRGGVMGLLRIDSASRQISYVGVGNIGIYVLSARSIKPISKNGILGHNQLPSLLEQTSQYDEGDTFIMYSDGISTRFLNDVQQIRRSRDPEELATSIMTGYGKPIDDVTVVVLMTGA